MQDNALIDVRNVTKVYHVGTEGVHALRGADLKIASGDICSIIGRSGSGKSTLLNVLAGLEQVSGGEIVIAGKHLERMTQGELIMFRQRHIGFIFQSFNLMPYYTALENVALPLEIAGVGDARARAEAELAAVGLAHRRGHYPSEMSGGEQQRVALARAVVPRPAILLADEPTGNLDAATGRQIIDLMFAINAESGTTLILVTHDEAIAARCVRRLRMHAGTIAEAA